MECKFGTNLVRYLFFGFNLLFWILGLVVLGVGIYSRVENDSWKDLLNSSTLFQAANLLIASGFIVAITGFMGCCGAIKKYQWMLIVYTLLIVLVVILEIAAGVYGYSKRDTVIQKMTEGLSKGVKKTYGKTDTASKGITKAIDWFQTQFKCCGANGTADWKDSAWFKSKKRVLGAVPASCKTYKVGCVTSGVKFAQKNMKAVASVGVGIAIVELLGIVFALCLCFSFRRDEKYESV